MRAVLVLILASACQTASSTAPPPPARGSAAVALAPSAGSGSVSGSGSAAGSGSATGGIQVARSVAQPDLVTPECIAVADHLVGLSLAALTDPAERTAQTANRAKTVREAAESCARSGWSPALIQCFAKAKTASELPACDKLVTPAK